jgi:hypothetical protein
MKAITLTAIAASLACSHASSAATVRFDDSTLSGLGARNIGSAMMSGRVSALDAYEENGKITLYVGAASGGVWKSKDGGTTFEPIFDKQPVQSIGDQSQYSLGRHRRILGAQFGVVRRWHLQKHRRRPKLDAHGSEDLRAHQ